MIVSLASARHSFSGCPCGHPEHLGRASLGAAEDDGLSSRLLRNIGVGGTARVVCPECAKIEEREGVILSIETAARMAILSIGAGSVVKCEGQTCRIIGAAPITKLGGAIDTGYVRVKLREIA